MDNNTVSLPSFPWNDSPAPREHATPSTTIFPRVKPQRGRPAQLRQKTPDKYARQSEDDLRERWLELRALEQRKVEIEEAPKRKGPRREVKPQGPTLNAIKQAEFMLAAQKHVLDSIKSRTTFTIIDMANAKFEREPLFRVVGKMAAAGLVQRVERGLYEVTERGFYIIRSFDKIYNRADSELLRKYNVSLLTIRSARLKFHKELGAVARKMRTDGLSVDEIAFFVNKPTKEVEEILMREARRLINQIKSE